MTGLEYILFVKEMKVGDLAEILEVSAPLPYFWIKGQRTIQEKELEQLEVMFPVGRDLLLKPHLTSLDRMKIEAALFGQEEGEEDPLQKALTELHNLKRNYSLILEENEELHLKINSDKEKIISFIKHLD